MWYDMKQIQRICCVGLGYVGLPTAVVLASEGVQVLGCDINKEAVDLINQGQAHFQENDMDIILKQVVKSRKLIAYTEPQSADAFLIAVPTPFKDNKTPDMRYVILAAEAISNVLQEGNIVILESTSPVGSTEMIRNVIKQKRPDLFEGSDKILFAYCPERILPGNTMRELRENSRCVGGLTPEASGVAQSIYKIFCAGEVLLTNARTAEMVKLGENSFRDVNIAYANEMAKICANNDVDVHEFIKLANHHPRVNILSPGIGVGGHCIPVDPWFLVADNSEEAKLLYQARIINDSMPQYYADIVQNTLSGKTTAKIAILGLTYKPDVDDFRCSPSIELVNILSKNTHYEINAHDPFIDQIKLKEKNPSVNYFNNINLVIEDADVVVISTPHSEYKNICFGTKLVIDPSSSIIGLNNNLQRKHSKIAA